MIAQKFASSCLSKGLCTDTLQQGCALLPYPYSPSCVHLLLVQAIPLIFCLYYIFIVFILKTKNVCWFYSELTCRCFVAFFQLASSLISHSTFCPASRAVSVSIAGTWFYSALRILFVVPWRTQPFHHSWALQNANKLQLPEHFNSLQFH